MLENSIIVLSQTVKYEAFPLSTAIIEPKYFTGRQTIMLEHEVAGDLGLTADSLEVLKFPT